MNILILGGTGFIGTALCTALLARGDQVVTPSRSPGKYSPSSPEHNIPFWDGKTTETLRPLLENIHAVVNLAGENIAGSRWDEETRRRIVQSRTLVGECLTQAMQGRQNLPSTLIQASASGYYGGWTDNAPALTEDAPLGKTFLASVCSAWEKSTQPVEQLGVRRCIIRTSPVLGFGGILDRFLPLFRLGLGGSLGNGKQPFPWIQLTDEVRAIIHLLDHTECQGPFNLCAPEQDTMDDFVRALGKVLHRPTLLRVPAFAARLAFGQMAEELLLSGQRVQPAKLLRAGFSFQYATLREALEVSMPSPHT